MRKFIVAPILVFIAAPALATQGLTCSAAGKEAPSVGVVIGHAAEPGIAQANLFDGTKDVPVAISQSWIDDSRVWVNLGDPDLMALVAKLRVTGKGANRRGTLWLNGKTYAVRCTGDE